MSMNRMSNLHMKSRKPTDFSKVWAIPRKYIDRLWSTRQCMPKYCPQPLKKEAPTTQLRFNGQSNVRALRTDWYCTNSTLGVPDWASKADDEIASCQGRGIVGAHQQKREAAKQRTDSIGTLETCHVHLLNPSAFMPPYTSCLLGTQI